MNSFAQVKQKIRERQKILQVSLFPGIGTNGIASGMFVNRFSINFFGGLSAGNTFLEIGGISNVNLKASNGIQLAGMANIVGANAFVNLSQSEERQLILKDDFHSNYIGIQIAGFLNYVREHATGIELAGGLNVVGRDFNGFQWSGFGNSAGGFVSGVQWAGLYNIAYKGMAGLQIGSVYNYTRGLLSGAQIGLVNRAGRIRGRRSNPPGTDRGMQLGVLNMAKEMDGLQVGIVNVGGPIKGFQLGLVNSIDGQPQADGSKAGVPVALWVLGSKGSVMRLYHSELSDVQAEYTTGNCSNCTRVFASEMPYTGRNKIFNQNALMIGFNVGRPQWIFGWGFERLFYNRFVTMAHRKNERRMFSGGLRLAHLNRERKFDNAFNVVSRAHFEWGKRRKSNFWFIGLALNYLLYEGGPLTIDAYGVRSKVFPAMKVAGLNSVWWPGYSAGLQF